MSTDKSAAAMKASEELRKIAEKWGWFVKAISIDMTQFELNKDTEQFISDLTALISEHYVAKAAYIALENTLAKAEAKNLELLQQRDELREALADMVSQFAYRGTYEGRENLHTGGLSALESAFDALGISDPITVLGFEAAIKNTER